MATDHETISTLEATPVKLGPGASQDAGWELKRLGVKRALLVTDPGVAALGHPERIKKLIEAEGIDVVVYDHSRVEPTSDWFQDAYPVAGLKHEYEPRGYPTDHKLVPHRPLGHREPAGTVPLHVRGDARAPLLPRRAAHRRGDPDAGPDTLPDVLRQRMRDVGAPRGIAEFVYTEDDVPALVEEALKQQRLLVIGRREPSADELRHIINASLTNW
jgi:alcohol dehydrogenase class IV